MGNICSLSDSLLPVEIVSVKDYDTMNKNTCVHFSVSASETLCYQTYYGK